MRLGVITSPIVAKPANFTLSEALLEILPADSLPIVEASTLPPSAPRRFLVSKLHFPPLPIPRVKEVKRLV